MVSIWGNNFGKNYRISCNFPYNLFDLTTIATKEKLNRFIGYNEYILIFELSLVLQRIFILIELFDKFYTASRKIAYPIGDLFFLFFNGDLPDSTTWSNSSIIRRIYNQQGLVILLLNTRFQSSVSVKVFLIVFFF